MPLFKKKPLIPPVADEPTLNVPSPTIRRSSPSPYPYTPTASRDDAPNYSSDIQPYNRNKGAGDVYSRGTAELEKDRNELFSGYNPVKSGSGRFFDGPDVKDNEAGEGEEDDVEGIKQQTRYVKQESVNSTRNALRLAREAEEIGQSTMNRLVEQSGKLSLHCMAPCLIYNAGKLYSTEVHLGTARLHADRAKDKTNELKDLNRSIFRPTWTIRKERKAVEVADPNEAYHDIMRRDLDDDRNDAESLVGANRTKERSKELRKRYQFDATASDDELEDEMDDNLEEIRKVTSNLKKMGIGMGEELNRQNGYIDVIDRKTGDLDDRVRLNTERVRCCHSKLSIFI